MANSIRFTVRMTLISIGSTKNGTQKHLYVRMCLLPNLGRINRRSSRRDKNQEKSSYCRRWREALLFLHMESVYKTVSTGQPQLIEWYSQELARWFESYSYVPIPGNIGVVYRESLKCFGKIAIG
jgi:hypothetical protein